MVDKISDYKYVVQIDGFDEKIRFTELTVMKDEFEKIAEQTFDVCEKIQFDMAKRANEQVYEWMMASFEPDEPFRFPRFYLQEDDFLHEMISVLMRHQKMTETIDECVYETHLDYKSRYFWLVCPRSKSWMWDCEIEAMYIEAKYLGDLSKKYMWTDLTG